MIVCIGKFNRVAFKLDGNTDSMQGNGFGVDDTAYRIDALGTQLLRPSKGAKAPMDCVRQDIIFQIML